MADLNVPDQHTEFYPVCDDPCANSAKAHAKANANTEKHVPVGNDDLFGHSPVFM